MCWSETAKTARAMRGRLKALQVATAAAAVDGTACCALDASNLCSTLWWLWLLECPEAWLELLGCPVPSSSSLGITAPESWLDLRTRIDLMSLMPACRAVSDSVSPCWAVLAAAAAATAAETAAVAAADVSLGRRAAYSIWLCRKRSDQLKCVSYFSVKERGFAMQTDLSNWTIWILVSGRLRCFLRDGKNDWRCAISWCSNRRCSWGRSAILYELPGCKCRRGSGRWHFQRTWTTWRKRTANEVASSYPVRPNSRSFPVKPVLTSGSTSIEKQPTLEKWSAFLHGKPDVNQQWLAPLPLSCFNLFLNVSFFSKHYKHFFTLCY